MYLRASNLVPYLLQKGILQRSELFRSDWFVSQADSRKPVLCVANLDGRGWIVKQASPLNQHHVAMLDREAALFQLANKAAWARSLKGLMPQLCSYDPGVHALIIEYLAYDTGLDHLRRECAKPHVLGRLIGERLAAVHIAVGKCNGTASLLSERLPWILQINSAELSEREAPSVRQVVALIRREPELTSALIRLEREWRNDTLIHGDAKLDNVLVRTGHRPRLWFVDWAFAGIGDPAWDVGTIVHSCLLLWLQGIQFKRGQSLDESLREATLPLVGVQTFAREFVSSYNSAKLLSDDTAVRFARRASLYAGAALLQSAVAAARVQNQMTARQLAAIQMGSHILNDPNATLAEFLMISKDAVSPRAQGVM